MKKFFLVLFFLLPSCDIISDTELGKVFSELVCIISGQEDEIIRHDVIVMVDNTEGGVYKWAQILPFEDLKKIWGVENGKQVYGSITFTDVNNVSMNKTETIMLPEPTPIKRGETALQKKLKAEGDKTALKTAFGKIESSYKIFIEMDSKKEIPNSMIYKPMCVQLGKLSQSTAEKKTLIILSDMVENSTCGNFYKIKGNYQKIIEELVNCSGCRLKSDGVQVIILFRTENPEKDMLFNKAIEVWDVIFKMANVQYELKPNL